MSALDHGVLGNGHLIALISPAASVDWLCLPRFDSPSVFAGLLDPAAGAFEVLPEAPLLQTEAAYHPRSNGLRTTLYTAAGRVAVDDICPPGVPELLRILRPMDGPLTIRIRFEPRGDYGRAPGGATLWTRAPVNSSFTLDGPLAMVVAQGAARTDPADAQAILRGAVAADREWCGSVPDALARSALCLRLHTYAPTGAIIAAATTSIPEALGTPRTWDYRYAWIRDGAFAAHALLELGFTEEARRFLDFVVEAVGDDVPRPLYGVGGERDLPERKLPHLAGFEGTGPVRVGNAAALQRQHDSEGQIVWLADALDRRGVSPDAARYAWLARQVDRAATNADRPDDGVWEFRGRPRLYTFSRAWCWVALHRGARLADRRGDEERARRWRTRADALRGALLAEADRVGFFAQAAGSEDADASSLCLASLGLIDGRDPRFVATVRRCEEVLLTNGLMRRYQVVDDFGETTSAFGLCTLWWAEALARIGEVSRAESVLDGFLARANPVGLFSEDFDPDAGRMLGNFPQVYSHVGIIEAWRSIRTSGRR